MRLSSWLLAVTWVGALGLVGCDNKIAGGSTDGKAIFGEACARCHGDGGKPSEQMRSSLGVKDLTDGAFHARATQESVAQFVRTGSASKIMPAYETVLTADQIDAVAAYVISLPVSP